MKRTITTIAVVALLLALSPDASWGRGFGGGRGGGGGRSFGGGGGGFRGGAGGGFSGAGNFRGGAGGLGGAEFNRGGLGGANFNRGGLNPGGGAVGNNRFGGAQGSGRLPGNQPGAGFRGENNLGGGAGNRFSGGAPDRSQLGNFLGLPSDGGLHGLGNNNVENFNRNFNSGGASDNWNVNHGSYDGPRGGSAAGSSVTGPRGNTAYRGGAETAGGVTAAGRGVTGAGGGAAGQGVVAGPGGRVVAGEGVRGPNGGAAARGVAAGPRGYATGFAAQTPSGRYASATTVRRNFNHYGLYGPNWHTAHPGAWYAAGWNAGSAWRAASWASLGAWFAYNSVPPVYYDYGNNVTYQENNVYVNGQDYGTGEQYYDQAATLATTGGEQATSDTGEWLPLGVFAMSQSGQESSNMVIQLAVDKNGVIRGNYTDTASNATLPVQGSVDKQTQRAAWTIGSNKTTVIETGIYNLTKDEAPALVHFGADRTEQWLLVRLNQPQQ